MEKILILSPHTDDAELGCGGTIAKFIQQGKQITVVAFSWCDNPELKKEFTQSMTVLGVRCYRVYSYERRIFNERRQEILDNMIELRNELNPDLVFCPYSADTHQDHEVIHNETIRAFKNCSILGYELPWNGSGNLNAVVGLGVDHAILKNKALSFYNSQSNRIYFDDALISSWLMVRGKSNGLSLAECFEVIKWYV